MMDWQKELKYIDSYRFPINSETIDISWDLLNICNYKCSYCYIGDFKKDNFFFKGKSLKRLINNINLLEKPVIYRLLGGEPTLHPEFFNIMKYLHNDQTEKIRLVTNFSKPKEFWNKFIKETKHISNKIEIEYSVHLEYFKNCNFDIIKKLLDNGYNFSASILAHPSYYNTCLKAFNELLKLTSYQNFVLSIIPLFYQNYDNNYYDLIKKSQIYEPHDVRFHYNETKDLPYSDILINKWNNFSNMKCNVLRFLTINNKGIVGTHCNCNEPVSGKNIMFLSTINLIKKHINEYFPCNINYCESGASIPKKW